MDSRAPPMPRADEVVFSPIPGWLLQRRRPVDWRYMTQVKTIYACEYCKAQYSKTPSSRVEERRPSGLPNSKHYAAHNGVLTSVNVPVRAQSVMSSSAMNKTFATLLLQKHQQRSLLDRQRESARVPSEESLEAPSSSTPSSREPNRSAASRAQSATSHGRGLAPSAHHRLAPRLQPPTVLGCVRREMRFTHFGARL